MKPRLRIFFYDTVDKGISISFTEVYPDGTISNHFWGIDDYFYWFYKEQHFM